MNSVLLGVSAVSCP